MKAQILILQARVHALSGSALRAFELLVTAETIASSQGATGWVAIAQFCRAIFASSEKEKNELETLAAASIGVTVLMIPRPNGAALDPEAKDDVIARISRASPSTEADEGDSGEDLYQRTQNALEVAIQDVVFKTREVSVEKVRVAVPLAMHSFKQELSSLGLQSYVDELERCEDDVNDACVHMLQRGGSKGDVQKLSEMLPARTRRMNCAASLLLLTLLSAEIVCVLG